MYVAEINHDFKRSLAYVDFRGKAAAGVHHFFVPAHVNNNHYVLFWVFGLQTGEQPYVLLMDSIGSGPRSAKALAGDCSTVMQNIREQLPKQVKVGILQCPQQAEIPYQHCGLYLLYNLERVLESTGVGEDNFRTCLQSFVDPDITLTQSANRTLNDMSKSIFKDFPASAWRCDKFPPISLDTLKDIKREIIREIEGLYADYAQQSL